MIMDNKNIIQSYLFSRLRASLNVYELRLLMRVVEFAQCEIQGLIIAENKGPVEHSLTGRVVEIPLSSVLMSGSHHYDRVQAAARSLMKKIVEHIDLNAGKWTAATLVSAAESYKGEGTVKLYIQPWVWDCILDFTRGFVKFDLGAALKLSSPYAVRLLFLMSYQKQPICYSFNELRRLFGVEELYAKNNDFVRRVLLPAKQELDAKSPWSCDIRPMREGRKLTTCMFYPYEQRDKYSPEVFEKGEQAKYPSVWAYHGVYQYMRYNLEFSPVELGRNKLLIHQYSEFVPDALSLLADMTYRARMRENMPGKGWFIEAMRSELEKHRPGAS